MIKKMILLLCIALNVQFVLAFDHGHKDWNKLLQKYTVQGSQYTKVDYSAFQKNKFKLKKYLTQLEGVDKATFDLFNPKQQLSFLINAYNAFTIQLVAHNYPVNSIKDIVRFNNKDAGWFEKKNPKNSPWNINFIQLLGKKRSLNHIEHDVLRKKYNEPRIHFLINCASESCPSLPRVAITEKNIETQMNTSARYFLANTFKNNIDFKNKEMHLSKIFKWFGSDFDKNYNSYIGFIQSFYPDKDIKSFKVIWKKYIWKLNE